MPMSVTYATINGEIVSENRGGVIRYYVPDTNGNTIALLDESGNVTDTYEYWPFGEIRSHVGPSTTPFTFGGVLGCYSDSWGGIYMRAREFVPKLARWLTVDPLWPWQLPYVYAGNSPVTQNDPTGMAACNPVLDDFGWIATQVPIPSHFVLGSTVASYEHPCGPADVIACQRKCASLGLPYGGLSGSVGIGSNGTPEQHCNCSCTVSDGTCTMAQIIFCVNACHRSGLNYKGCSAKSPSQTNDASICDCSVIKK